MAKSNASATAPIDSWIGGATQVQGLVEQTGSVAWKDILVTSRLVISAGGTWDLDTSTTNDVSLGGSGAGVFIAGSATTPGLLELTGSSDAAVSGNITNFGENVSSTHFGGIEVAANTLTVGNVTGIGAINIVNQNTGVDVTGSIGSGQTAYFWGSYESMEIATPGAFKGEFSGFDKFGVDDAISVGDGWKLYGSNQTSSQTTLSLVNGSELQTLVFAGDYTGGAFHSHVFGQTSIITYS